MIRKIALTLALALAVMVAPVAALADAERHDYRRHDYQRYDNDERSGELSIVLKLAPGQIDAVGDIVASRGAQVQPLIASRGVVRATMTVQANMKDAQKAAKKLAASFSKDDRVQWAQVDSDAVVDDTRFYAWPHGSPTAASPRAAKAPAALDSMQLDAVHRISTGAGVVVAVLDTGVDAAHPLLAGHVMAGYDMVDDDAQPADAVNGVDDDGDGQADEAYGHGTFVAGVIRQVAPSATILPVRVLNDDGQGEIYSVIEGIDYAIAAGADVINLSFGAMSEPASKPLKEAVKRAHKADVALVAAAGNDAGEQERYPAAYSEVIGVTAADTTGQELAGFATVGHWIDLAAPGVAVVSALPHDAYATWAGSSVATGVVSGQVALLRQFDPKGDVKHVEKRLLESARKLEDKRTKHGVTDVLASVQ